MHVNTVIVFIVLQPFNSSIEMDSILNQDDDEIYVYCSASKEDAVKIRKRQVTAERLAIMFNVS
jgi:hypothetical protein